MNAEEIQKIVNEAPEGATHVEVEECGRFTFYQHDIEENHWSEYNASSGNFKIGISELIVDSICNLNDLREILQLRTLLEQVTRAADVVLEKWKQGDVDVSYIYALEEARANAGALTDENE